MEKNIQLSDNSWIKIINNYINLSSNEFEELWDLRPNEPSHVILFNKKMEIPRLQKLYGTKPYNFSGVSVQPESIENPILINILQKINNMDPDIEYNAIFINWYRNGNDYIGYHSDDEKDLTKNAPIYSISLGETRKFKVKNKINNKITDIEMNNGTLIIMGGEIQKEFKHSVPKTKKNNGRRINLTIRSFRDTSS